MDHYMTLLPWNLVQSYFGAKYFFGTQSRPHPIFIFFNFRLSGIAWIWNANNSTKKKALSMKFGQDVGNQLNNRLPSSNFKILEYKHIIFIRTSQPLILSLLGRLTLYAPMLLVPFFAWTCGSRHVKDILMKNSLLWLP